MDCLRWVGREQRSLVLIGDSTRMLRMTVGTRNMFMLKVVGVTRSRSSSLIMRARLIHSNRDYALESNAWVLWFNYCGPSIVL